MLRFIPEGDRPYFDKIDIGWCFPINNYVQYDSESIFSCLDQEVQSNDQLYSKIMSTTNFVKPFIEILLQDLGIKADNQIIQSNSANQKITIKTTIK